MLPAHAGMVPASQRTPDPAPSAPRARGDGPHPDSRKCHATVCSPRTRGWSRPGRRRRRRPEVLPAHAGMVPDAPRALYDAWGAPRARGDGPNQRGRSNSSPPCSPRTRGWSPDDLDIILSYYVLPAHAGMVPRGCRPATGRACAPRARGDGPQWSLFNRHGRTCSPRTRGWSRVVGQGSARARVLPAHAGMVPGHPCPDAVRHGAPRARGDGPGAVAAPARLPGCSPRTRGWSQARDPRSLRARVLPAHAGMVPARRYGRSTQACAPRARGDGPGPRRREVAGPGCSPRTRGWSRHQPAGRGHARVLPAHAGMVP